MTPNQTQVLLLVRAVLMFVGSYLVTKGYLSSDQLSSLTASLAQIAGPVLMAAPIIWGLFAHTKAATVARAADIVAIPAAEQNKAGILNPQITPTNPKVL